VAVGPERVRREHHRLLVNGGDGLGWHHCNATHWDEVRLAGAPGILFAAGVTISMIALRGDFDFTRTPTRAYAGMVVLFALGMALFYWWQERLPPRR